MTIKHHLCERKALYRKRIVAIGRGFLDVDSDVAQIKLSVLVNFIRSTGVVQRAHNSVRGF